MTQDPNAPVPPQAAGGNPQVPDYGTPTPQVYQGAPPTKDDQNMALLCYILAIFTGWIGPLIIWLMKKETSPFVNDQGKEVLNWEITLVFAWIAGVATSWIFGLGILIIIVAGICNLIFNILGAMKVSKGIPYRYPFALRLIK
ncbi:MAG: hypothetical protein JWN24_3938 [Phycisphaerales bacterium]|nr:hypothetical protein [Phycisphaerales bacterium]